MLKLSKNKKIANSRWEAKIKKERNQILNTEKANVLKAMICGFLAGDGSVQVRKEKSFYHYQLDFFPDDKLMMEKYINAIKKVYRKTPSIRLRDNVFHVRKTSKTIVTDLLKLACFDTQTWSIPDKILNNKETKAAWLNAFFSAEAYVNKNSIRIQIVNKKGINDISKLLDYFEIKHRTYEYLPKKENYSKVYILTITQKNERRKFYKKIGFWHEKKNTVLRATLNL